MDVLDELVRAGKVRILGCSNETSWGLMKSLATAEQLGTTRFQTIQNNFSMNNRRFEDELAEVCRLEGVSLIPYSPLAGGVLSGKYQDGATPEGARFSAYIKMGGRQMAQVQRFAGEKALASTAAYMKLAAEAGLDIVTMATAWSKQHDFVASTIVGVTHEDQLPQILAAADMELPADLMKAIYKISREIMYPMG
jgi:aryl-alcohol dehydrogenase-like predicted oxidoreductase